MSMARRALILLALCAGAGAFSRRSAARTGGLRRGAGEGDPTKVWYAELANGLQNVLTNSPLNEGKKAVVRALAGPYDAAEVGAKLDALIADEPVLMLSFVR